jgi:hypothetical protein
MQIEWEDLKTELLNNHCVLSCPGQVCRDHCCTVWQLMKVCDKSKKVVN